MKYDISESKVKHFAQIPENIKEYFWNDMKSMKQIISNKPYNIEYGSMNTYERLIYILCTLNLDTEEKIIKYADSIINPDAVESEIKEDEDSQEEIEKFIKESKCKITVEMNLYRHEFTEDSYILKDAKIRKSSFSVDKANLCLKLHNIMGQIESKFKLHYSSYIAYVSNTTKCYVYFYINDKGTVLYKVRMNSSNGTEDGYPEYIQEQIIDNIFDKFEIYK